MKRYVKMRKYADGAWLNAKQQNQQAQLAPVYGAVGNMANTFLQPSAGEDGFVDWNNQKNVNSSIGGSTLQAAGQGAALGANPALIAATGGLSVPIGAVLGAGVGFFKGKSDADKQKTLYNKYLQGQQTAMHTQGIQNYQSNLQQGFEPMGNVAQSKTGFKKGGVIKKYPDGGFSPAMLSSFQKFVAAHPNVEQQYYAPKPLVNTLPIKKPITDVRKYKGQDESQLLKHVVQLVDPTGISSYGDAADTFSDPKSTTADKVEAVISVIPVLGKLTKIKKGIKVVQAAFDGNQINNDLLQISQTQLKKGGRIRYKKGGNLNQYPNGGITSTDTQSLLLPKNKDYLALSYGNSSNNNLNNNLNLDFGKKLGKLSTTDNDTSFLGRTMLEGNLSKNTNYDIGAALKIPFSGNSYGKVGVNNLLSGAKPFAELNAEKGWNFGGGRYNQNPIGRVNTHGNLFMTTGQDPNLKIGTGVNLNLGNNFGVNGNIDYSINRDNSGRGIALPNSNNVQGNVGLTYTPNLNSNKSSQEEQIRLAKLKRIRNNRANTYTPPSFKKGGMIRYADGRDMLDDNKPNELNNYVPTFAKGGYLDDNKPIYTSNPNDPRLRAYSDSLIAFDSGLNRLKGTNGGWDNKAQEPQKNKATNKIYKGGLDRLKFLDVNKKDNILPIGAYVNLNDGYMKSHSKNDNNLFYPAYAKPVQPYKLRTPIIKKQQELVKAGLLKSNEVDGIWGKGSESAWGKYQEDTKYNDWKSKLPKNLQYEGDYDLKGFYKENPTWTPDNKDVHMTDKFKLPNHPTFSNESMYYKEGMKAGYWAGDKYTPLKEGEKVPVNTNSFVDPIWSGKDINLISRVYKGRDVDGLTRDSSVFNSTEKTPIYSKEYNKQLEDYNNRFETNPKLAERAKAICPDGNCPPDSKEKLEALDKEFGYTKPSEPTPKVRPAYNPYYDLDYRAEKTRERLAQSAAFGEAKKTNPKLTLAEFQRTYNVPSKISTEYGKAIPNNVPNKLNNYVPTLSSGGRIKMFNPKNNSQQTGGSQTSFPDGGWLDNYNK